MDTAEVLAVVCDDKVAGEVVCDEKGAGEVVCDDKAAGEEVCDDRGAGVAGVDAGVGTLPKKFTAKQQKKWSNFQKRLEVKKDQIQIGEQPNSETQESAQTCSGYKIDISDPDKDEAASNYYLNFVQSARNTSCRAPEVAQPTNVAFDIFGLRIRSTSKSIPEDTELPKLPPAKKPPLITPRKILFKPDSFRKILPEPHKSMPKTLPKKLKQPVLLGSPEGQSAQDKRQPDPAKVQAAPCKGQGTSAKGQPAPTKMQPAPSKAQPAPTTRKPASAMWQPVPAKMQPAPCKGQPASAKGQIAPTKAQPAPSKGQPAPTKRQPTSASLVQPDSQKSILGPIPRQHPGQTGNKRQFTAPTTLSGIPKTFQSQWYPDGFNYKGVGACNYAHAGMSMPYYTGDPMANYAGNPMANYAGNPMANYPGNPMANYPGNPMANYAGNPRANYAGNPMANYAANPIPNYMGTPMDTSYHTNQSGMPNMVKYPEIPTNSQLPTTNWNPLSAPSPTGVGVPDQQSIINSKSGPLSATDSPANITETIKAEGSASPQPLNKGKVSAFERLGPPIASEPKKPKLTINLMFAKNEVLREVVEEHVPVYLRQDILSSDNEIVKMNMKLWPWKSKVKVIKESSYSSSDVLLDEYSHMSVVYESKSAWIKVTVSGYPANFKKEDVLDIILADVDKMEFIPCFIEFKQNTCWFLLNKSEDALTYLHKNGLVVHKDDIKLNLTVAHTILTLDNLRFFKGSVFKTTLDQLCDQTNGVLNLSAFMLQPDISHLIYFPLNNPHNQVFVMNISKACLHLDHITSLNLSGNRLKSVDGFNLDQFLPALQTLDLSDNLLPNVCGLVCLKGINLTSLVLERNPLCGNFIQQDHYIEVVKLIFPKLKTLDSVSIENSTEIKKDFSVSMEALDIVSTFLEVYFTLIDSNERALMDELYAENAVFSITCRPEMRRNPVYRNLKEFYMWCRTLNDSINPNDPLEGTIVGGPKIAKYFTKWPNVLHDPYSFTVDVFYHTDTVTMFKVTGLFKIPSEILSLDEPVTEFSRTFVLSTENGVEYKIANDMMYISEASKERVVSGFQFVGLQQQKPADLTLKFDTPPDDDLKEKLTQIFMKLTDLRRKPSERCLQIKGWDLQMALENFIRLEKLDATGTLDL